MTGKRTQSNLLKVCNVIILDKENVKVSFLSPNGFVPATRVLFIKL